jgi:opacity protein-like surface antigen
MISLRATLAGLAMLAGSTVPVLAADLGDYHEDDTSIASNARFYLRGDLGYSWYQTPSLSEDGVSLTDVSIGRNWAFGGGIGMYLSPNWRTDLTIERRNDVDIHGFMPSSDVNIEGTRDFSVVSNVVLANLYYDFSGRAGFNPYLGAGIGWASNQAHHGSAVDTCGCVSAIEDDTQTSFAWGLMAGVTRELDRGFSLDLGYRFLDVGKAHTGNIVNSTTNAAIDNTDPATGDLRSHEVRVGIRYDIF